MEEEKWELALPHKYAGELHALIASAAMLTDHNVATGLHSNTIKVLMDQRERELDNWEELVQKAVEAEAKARLQPAFILCEMDRGCPRGNRPTQVTMSKIQATATCDPRDEPIASVEGTQISEPKLFYSNTSRSQSPKSTTSHSRTDKPDKKSRRQQKKQHRLEQGRNLARKNLSHIICFNCDKRGHYADKCTEPKANSSEK